MYRIRVRRLWPALIPMMCTPRVFGASVVLKPGDDVYNLTTSLQAGDVIEFSDGVFPISRQLDWDGIGTESSPIILKAQDGAHPVLRLDAEGGGRIASVHDAEYLVIDGLTFTGPDDTWMNQSYGGLQIYSSKHITVRNCEVRQVPYTALEIPYENLDVVIEHNALHDTLSGHGIYMGYSDGSLRATGCTIHNNWIYNIGGSGSYGIYVSRGSYGNTFTDNNIYAVENRGIGLAQYTFSDDVVDDPNIVERNAVWNVGSVGIEAHGAALIRNNIVFNSNGYGIYSTPAEDDTAADLVLANNTIEGTVQWAVYYRQRVGTYVLANNVVCNPLGYAFNEDYVDETNVADVLVSNNIACGLIDAYDDLDAGFSAGAGLDDFTNAGSFDFWPATGSHLIDAGSADSALEPPSDDFNGQPRNLNAPDVGAYERTGADNPGWVIAEGFKDTGVEDDGGPVTTEAGCGSCSSAGGRRLPWGDALLIVAAAGLGTRRRSRR